MDVINYLQLLTWDTGEMKCGRIRTGQTSGGNPVGWRVSSKAGLAIGHTGNLPGGPMGFFFFRFFP